MAAGADNTMQSTLHVLKSVFSLITLELNRKCFLFKGNIPFVQKNISSPSVGAFDELSFSIFAPVNGKIKVLLVFPNDKRAS